LAARISLSASICRGAEPGNFLEVKILEIAFPTPTGVNVVIQTMVLLGKEFPYLCARAIPLDKSRNVGIAGPGIEIPLRPFFGTLGVCAPSLP